MSTLHCRFKISHCPSSKFLFYIKSYNPLMFLLIKRHAKTCFVARPDPPVLPHPLTPEVAIPFSPTQLSLSSSPPNFPMLFKGDYMPVPDHQTVVEHLPYNLPSLGVIINQHFHCLICVNCERAIDPLKLIHHIHQENPLVEIPEDLPSILETTYQLVTYSSIVYTPGPISPIFGITLHPHPLYFCDCGKGYASYDILRTHQTRRVERGCTLRDQNPGYHQGYGQRLTGNRSFFEVDPKVWLKDTEDNSEFHLAFSRSLPPLRDYSRMEIKGAEDEMNTSSFFYKQRWLFHLKDYTPQDIQEVLQESTPEAPYGELLRQVAEIFLKQANDDIQTHNSFGILIMIGRTTE
jgi:hypothetical protein